MEYAVKSDLSASVGETCHQWEKQDFSHTPFSHSKRHHRGIKINNHGNKQSGINMENSHRWIHERGVKTSTSTRVIEEQVTACPG